MTSHLEAAGSYPQQRFASPRLWGFILSRGSVVLFFFAVGVMVSVALSGGRAKAAPAMSPSTDALQLQTVQDAVLARRQGIENLHALWVLQDSLALLRRDNSALARRLEALEAEVQVQGLFLARLER